MINLAVNARDAMPDGGRLTIETANASLDDSYARDNPGVRPGQYVLIAVSDTGHGMTPELLEHVFEPFFTTKPVGKGTGLGLSQVYGFVQQSGGHVKVYSELEKGTTVKIYLPRLFEAAVERPAAAKASDAARGSVDEVIFLVEDDPLMLKLTGEGLRDLGYTVRPFDNAAAALEALDETTNVSLLLTDLVMPDINGRRLADEATRRRPALKVLFTTGYTHNAVIHSGGLEPGVNFLAKPFTIEQLGNKVRQVLG